MKESFIEGHLREIHPGKPSTISSSRQNGNEGMYYWTYKEKAFTGKDDAQMITRMMVTISTNKMITSCTQIQMT